MQPTLAAGGTASRLPENVIEEAPGGERTAQAGLDRPGHQGRCENPEAFWDAYLAALEEAAQEFVTTRAARALRSRMADHFRVGDLALES